MSYDHLESDAFIICENADCRYKPEISSPARITPPYGTKVEIIEDQGDWVKIEYVGKIAWCARSQLSSIKPKEKFDISPYIFRGYSPQNIEPMGQSDRIEYGPRGGRFTRTRTGHRRYF